ncbi:hypothetical protein [Dyella tabacisoli]|uniref:hypothetical protein n=1 Tax=Dyella tabacisoli TaxID=2282381 RepID=UPI0013B392F8|nr:hypothetical protein [Dyella tabacisoli]
MFMILWSLFAAVVIAISFLRAKVIYILRLRYPGIYDNVGRPGYMTNTTGFVNKLRIGYSKEMLPSDYLYVRWINVLNPVAALLMLVFVIYVVVTD